MYSIIASGLIFRSSFHHDGCMKYNPFSFRPRETNLHPLSWTAFKLIHADVLPFFLLLISLSKLSQKCNDKMTSASMKGSGLMSLRSHHTYSQLSANEYNIFYYLLPLSCQLLEITCQELLFVILQFRHGIQLFCEPHQLQNSLFPLISQSWYISSPSWYPRQLDLSSTLGLRNHGGVSAV